MSRQSRASANYRASLSPKALKQLDKLEAVRGSGYTGWLDQDCTKVPCPCCKKSGCTAGLTERCNG